MPQGADLFIQKLAKEAGALVLKRFGKDGVHYMKSDNAWDCVTEADLKADKFIVGRIKKAYPTHGIISEEGGVHNENAEYVWIADPIDGTMNFSRGVPMFGVMIALVHKKRVMLSAIHIPATKELFFAKHGKGSYLNGKRINCSRIQTLENSVGSGSSTMNNRNAKFVGNILRAGRRKRIQLGSFFSMAVNACYVTCGRRDWMVTLNGRIWDFAPAFLILKEAGCKVTDTNGNPWKFGTLEMVAANPTLHKKLLKLTKNI